MAAPGAGLPAGEPGQVAPDSASGWRAVTATERGAAHRAAGIPNQDAVAIIPLANGGIVAADRVLRAGERLGGHVGQHRVKPPGDDARHQHAP